MDYIYEAMQTPVIAKCDVAVVGGGIAGVAAALSAARQGADVLLLEKQYLLGGMATAGLIAIYLPLCDGRGRQISYGIADELFWLSIRHGAAGRVPTAWLDKGREAERATQRMKVQFDPNLFALLMEERLREEGVRILFGTAVCAVHRESDCIGALIVENSAGRSAIRCGAVVDASGDAVVCHLAGEKTANFTPGNRLTAWYYSLLEGRNQLHIMGESDEKTPLHEPAAAMLGKGTFDALDPWQLSEALGKAHAVQCKAFLQKGPVSEGHSLTTLPTLPQLRMTRRLCGVYEPGDEIVNSFVQDSIGLAADWRQPGKVYELPLRSLKGCRNANLWVAGRCISVADSLWDVTRVIPASAVTGEAAGIGATGAADVQQVLASRGIPLHLKDMI